MLHPSRDQIELLEVLAALGHPVRARIVRALAADEELSCGEVVPEVPKSTLTAHWRVLREAGVICQRPEGRKLFTRLRRDDLDARFPGLIDLLLAEDL